MATFLPPSANGWPARKVFARPDDEDGKFVPSLQLARSVGADLLTGRSEVAKTELSLGLAF